MIITRFAPEPNWYAHLGHLRGLLLMDKLTKPFRKRLPCRIYLRFDDTGAEDYRPEYYRSFLRLFRTYGIPLQGVLWASKRAPLYRSAVKRLLRQGRAYVCSCPNTTERRYREGNCDCRENVRSLNSLVPGESVRFKSHKESDYVIYRYVENLQKFSPTLALQSAVDDLALRVNFLYRGIDLQSSEHRHRQLYQSLGTLKYPVTRYWGKIQLYNSDTGEEYAISKSARIAPERIPSLPALEKTYGPSRLQRFLLSYGGTRNSIKVDLKRLQRSR